MKRLTLLSLGLVVLWGCGDATQQHEVNKPVIDGTPAPTHDPSAVNPLDPAAPAPEPTGSADVNADINNDSDLNDSDLNEAATPNPTGPVDTDIQTPADEVAPLDQNDPAKADLVAGIRTQIDDADLSDAAENIEVVAQDGKVTLSGKVKDQAEKDRIEEIANRLAGEGNVTNNLEIEQ
jgi:hypothetical protein